MSGRKRHGIRQETGSPPKNIVVFGESGAGKSSVINQIAGQSIAATSNSAMGCTFQHQKYELKFDDGTPCTIWDTPGLNEGTYGAVPAKMAEENLKHLLRDLTRANGVHLLVYCVKGSRLRQVSHSNYNLFYSAICRKKVPIVVIATGLEKYQEDMEYWWTANQSVFARLKMHFDGHACVTTLNPDEVNSPALKQRCHDSRRVVLDVIASACARDCLGTDSVGWVSAALVDIHAMFRLSRPKNIPPTMPIVAMYDLPERPLRFGSQNESPPLPFEGGQVMDVGGSPFLVYRIHDSQLGAGTRFKKQVFKRGADLLIFCTSLRVENTDAARRCAEEFYRSYDGDTRTLLVVIQDAPSDEVASQWWNSFCDGNICHRAQQPDGVRAQTIVRAVPPLENANATEAVVRLRGVIQTRALQPLDDVPSGCFRWLKSARWLPVRLAGGAQLELDSLARAHVWSPWPHDV